MNTLGRLTVKLLLWRFSSLVVSFFCTVMIWNSRSLSIQVSMVPGTVVQEEVIYKEREDILGLFWFVSLVCHFIEGVGVFFGTSLKSVATHGFSIFCHLLGSFLLVLGIMDSWDYRYYIWNFALFSFVPALIELYCIITFIIFDYNLMKQIEIRV
mmetsp:Transcript_10253/g.20441  ORF Transcript_10253/g.20441 Transcript_10253/m.20441 type:complete len:155 (-) Transcript_10253:69-533(-)